MTDDSMLLCCPAAFPRPHAEERTPKPVGLGVRVSKQRPAWDGARKLRHLGRPRPSRRIHASRVACMNAPQGEGGSSACNLPSNEGERVVDPSRPLRWYHALGVGNTGLAEANAAGKITWMSLLSTWVLTGAAPWFWPLTNLVGPYGMTWPAKVELSSVPMILARSAAARSSASARSSRHE